MANMVMEKKSITIYFKITKVEKNFINLIINQINNFTVQLSLSYKMDIGEFKHNNSKIYECKITKINIPAKFDRGCLPELEEYLEIIINN